MIKYKDYCVADPDSLETPAMLVFQDLVDHNIQSICELVGGGDGTTFAMQSNTHGGTNYDGLAITGNDIVVLNAGDENIFGVWENGHAHQSDITVSGNTFTGVAGNTGTQTAFRITSHSGASTTVQYDNNEVDVADVAFDWLDVYFGTPNKTTGTAVGQGTDWTKEYYYTAVDRLPTDYLYVATTSDRAGAQGFIGVFSNTTLDKTTTTGDDVWQVFAAGAFEATNPYWPDPWPESLLPTQEQVDTAIAYAQENNLWVTPLSFPEFDNDPDTDPTEDTPWSWNPWYYDYESRFLLVWFYLDIVVIVIQLYTHTVICTAQLCTRFELYTALTPTLMLRTCVCNMHLCAPLYKHKYIIPILFVVNFCVYIDKYIVPILFVVQFLRL